MHFGSAGGNAFKNFHVVIKLKIADPHSRTKTGHSYRPLRCSQAMNSSLTFFWKKRHFSGRFCCGIVKVGPIIGAFWSVADLTFILAVVFVAAQLVSACVPGPNANYHTTLQTVCPQPPSALRFPFHSLSAQCTQHIWVLITKNELGKLVRFGILICCLVKRISASSISFGVCGATAGLDRRGRSAL